MKMDHDAAQNSGVPCTGSYKSEFASSISNDRPYRDTPIFENGEIAFYQMDSFVLGMWLQSRLETDIERNDLHLAGSDSEPTGTDAVEPVWS